MRGFAPVRRFWGSCWRGCEGRALLSWSGMGSKKNKKLKALLFDFGGTLAFLDFELLAREFSREGRIVEALALEHAEYAVRAGIDQRLGKAPAKQADDSTYAHFFRAWMSAVGIGEAEMADCALRFGAIHKE